MASSHSTKTAGGRDPRLRIASGQRFECLLCGRCCRRWHVALSAAEIERLRSFDWGGEPGMDDRDPIAKIAGHPYIAHRRNGDCHYLDPATNLCRIHRRFGEAAKPIGCRVYPFNITSAFPGELGVTVRMDCPAAQQNAGSPIGDRVDTLRSYAREMGTKGGFDEDDTAGVSAEAVETVVGALLGLVTRDDLDPPVKSMAMLSLGSGLEALGPTFLNDTETLRAVLPTMALRAVESASGKAYGRLSLFSRVVFRQWLGTYLRRDEEAAMRGLGGRLTRTVALCRLLSGRGSCRMLGDEHPDVSLREAHVLGKSAFSPQPVAAAGADAGAAWEPYWRCVRGRLEALQFFGVSYYGATLFNGLRALVGTYALVLAAAKCHAADRAATRELAREDLEYGTGAIDHSFGRSGLLQMNALRSFEIYFTKRRYGRLLASLGWQ